MKRLLISMLLFTACDGGRRPPYVGGEGVLVEGQAIQLDTSKVPLVDPCSNGQLIKRTGPDTWACSDATLGTIADRLDALERDQTTRLDTLERRSTELEARLAEAESRRAGIQSELAAISADLAAERSPSYAVAAVTCLPEAEATRGRAISSADGRVRHRAAAIDPIEVFCPVIGTSTAPAWNRFALAYTDPDGSAPAARVRAELRALDLDGAVQTIATLDSNTSPSTATGEIETPLAHAFDFRARHYFISVILERAESTLAPEIIGLRLDRT